MKRPTFILGLVACGFLGFNALGTASAETPAATPAAPPTKVGVADTLKGHLISLVGKETQDFVIEGDPEYFVLYHSASW